MKKRIIASLLSLAVGLTMFPAQTHANDINGSELVVETEEINTTEADTTEEMIENEENDADLVATQTDVLDESEEEPPIPPSELWRRQCYNGIYSPDCNPYYDTKQTEWDCIWYGTYPQTEVFKNKKTFQNAFPDSWDATMNVDLGAMINSVLYSSLEKATWDDNNDTIIDGVKYHRISKESFHQRRVGLYGRIYNWDDTIPYHYFRYEPIKWRVISVSEETGNVVLISDKVLDDQLFYEPGKPETWEESHIRKWLNSDFINMAFSESERAGILSTTLKDVYIDSDCQTVDKVFLADETTLFKTAGFRRLSKKGEMILGFTDTKGTGYTKALGKVWGYNRQSAYIDINRSKDMTSWDCWVRDWASWTSMDRLERSETDKLDDDGYSGVRPLIQINLDVAPYRYAGSFKLEDAHTRDYTYLNVLSSEEEKNTECIVKGLFSQPGQENEVEITWQTCKGVDGYLIYGYHGSPKDGATYEYIGMRTENEQGTMSFTDSHASKDYNFYFVYPYVTDEAGNKIPGKCSKYTYCKGGQVKKLPAVQNLVAKPINASDRRKKLVWSKVEGAEGYLIYGFRGNPRDGAKYEYVGMTEATEYMDSTEEAINNICFYFVFAYRTDEDGNKCVGMAAPCAKTPYYLYWEEHY